MRVATQRCAERDDVGGHVAGIREQRQGPGDQAVGELDHEEHGDEAEGDGETPAVPSTGVPGCGSVAVSGAHQATPSVAAGRSVEPSAGLVAGLVAGWLVGPGVRRPRPGTNRPTVAAYAAYDWPWVRTR